VYEKSTGLKTLWRAENEEGYCEEKAKEFAEKQANWGYECSVSVAEATTAQAN
jgi:hypothetical protein